MTKSKTIKEIQAQISQLQQELIGEKSTSIFLEKASKINSLSVDLNNKRKQLQYKGYSEYVPDKIEIFN